MERRELQRLTSPAPGSRRGRDGALRLTALLATGGLLAAGCGSSIHPKVAASAHPAVGGGPKTGLASHQARAGAPLYCRSLSQASQVSALPNTIGQLAANPSSSAAHTALSQASTEIRRVASQATGPSRAALLRSATALDDLGRVGIKHAGRAVNSAMQNLANTLQGPCAFSKG